MAVIPDFRKETLLGFLKDNVEPGSTVYTDGLKSFTCFERPPRPGRVRRQGGGRKNAEDKDASLKSDLQHLLESTTRGDPEAPLRWTCKSVRQLTPELTRMKHRVSRQVVADLFGCFRL